jgi:hypothetical protein
MSDIEESVELTPPELSIQDLAILKSVVEAATQRGAIKPKELKIVGETYDKLDKFLSYIAQSQKSEEGKE